jgi:diaminopimelate epimerase
MKFTKAQCGGNDFVILDSRKENLPEDLNKLVRQIAKRRTGAGADGVIAIEDTDRADFRLRYFNPDGSEYDVCGDGSLCVILYEGKEKVVFHTGVGEIDGYLAGGLAKVKVVGPREARLSIALEIEGKMVAVNPVHIGVPHTVVPVPDIDTVDFRKLAPAIRYHPYFGNNGTNVNFMQVIDEHRIRTRTYERAVEGETFSCGSGSCACAVVGWLNGTLVSPIQLSTKGGDFRIYIDSLHDIWFEGSPKIVYEAEF